MLSAAIWAPLSFAMFSTRAFGEKVELTMAVSQDGTNQIQHLPQIVLLAFDEASIPRLKAKKVLSPQLFPPL